MNETDAYVGCRKIKKNNLFLPGHRLKAAEIKGKPPVHLILYNHRDKYGNKARRVNIIMSNYH